MSTDSMACISATVDQAVSMLNLQRAEIDRLKAERDVLRHALQGLLHAIDCGQLQPSAAFHGTAAARAALNLDNQT